MKNTVTTFQAMKDKGEKISMLTAYDYSTAKLEDAAGINGILVGDSLGNVVLGYDTTIPVTVEDMIHHGAAVARGAKNSLVVVDMPFLSYQTSVYDAVVNAGKIMKEGKANRKKVVQTLSVIGVLLVGLAMLWSLQMPIIKRLWTGSMTLLSGGYCFLLMALFYYWIDYKGHSRGLNWLKVYGMNSITAYLLGEVVNFRCIADSVSYGLKQYMGDYYPVWLTFANYLILFFLLRMMYKRGLFLKV